MKWKNERFLNGPRTCLRMTLTVKSRYIEIASHEIRKIFDDLFVYSVVSKGCKLLNAMDSEAEVQQVLCMVELCAVGKYG